eukprot:11164551-Lingulodinium_polyedra.AAC.1
MFYLSRGFRRVLLSQTMPVFGVPKWRCCSSALLARLNAFALFVTVAEHAMRIRSSPGAPRH